MCTAVVGIVEELFKRNVSDPGDVMGEGKEEIGEKYAFHISVWGNWTLGGSNHYNRQ